MYIYSLSLSLPLSLSLSLFYIHYLSLHSLFCYNVVIIITTVRVIDDFGNVRGILQFCSPVSHSFHWLLMSSIWQIPHYTADVTTHSNNSCASFTLAVPAIDHSIIVSNPAFILLSWYVPALNFGAHQSRNTITNQNVEPPIYVKVFLRVKLGHAELVYT